MDLIIKTVSRILFPFILLLGTYMAFHGHLSPGGAFPAGVIIATGFALLIISYREGDVEHRLTKDELIDLKSVSGIILIILILSLGHHIRDEVLATQNIFSLWSGGLTPVFNIAGMFMVVTAIVVILYTIVRE